MHPRLQRMAGVIFGATALIAAGGVGVHLRRTSALGVEVLAGNPEIRRWSLPVSETEATLGMLGGFRVPLADVAWIGMSHCWEECDRVGTLRGLRLATALHPESLYFWLNGARIIAYDLAAWRIQGSELAGHVPEAEKQRIARAQGLEAISFLEAAIVRFPGKALPWIELGQIRLRCLRDSLGAAEAFVRAADCRDAPDYALRIAAELYGSGGQPVIARRLLEKKLRGFTLLDVPPYHDRLSEKRALP
ncbi:MAG: hypothetical protein KBA71_13945 [Opitutaceae bacterium]|nr:hypothetical protein [Opitutaceae bacterium]